jgi:HSP20 family molecular chaperone IbpA
LSEDEDFDEVFRDLSAFVGAILPSKKVEDSAFGDIRQLENDSAAFIDDELILGDAYVTYIIHLPGSDLEGFSVVTGEREIELTLGDYKVKKELGVRVDGDDVSAECRNGVLSVRLKRLDDRDGGA